MKQGFITRAWSQMPLAWRERIRPIPNFFRRLLWGWRGVRVQAGGASFLVDYASGTEFYRARVFPTLEGDFTLVFGALASQAAVILDVGANMGLYSLLGASKNPSARVYALEPEPHNLEAIRRNLRANRLDNVTPLPLGLGDRQDTVILRLEGLSENAAGTGHHVVNQGEGLPILVADLDSLIAAGLVQPPDLIKMDIEGYEFKALKGMRRLLLEHHPDLLIEVHPAILPKHGESVEEMEAFLAALGYHRRVFACEDTTLIRAWYWACRE